MAPGADEAFTPKTMSSRLSRMKFMQRAAATAATSAASSSPATPAAGDSDGSAAKRRKVSHPGPPAGPATASVTSEAALFDHKAMRAALAEEESKRQMAIAERAAALGDARWVLSGAELSTPGRAAGQPALRVLPVGFAQIDSAGAACGRLGVDSDEEEQYEPEPKAFFLKFNMGKRSTKAGFTMKNGNDRVDSRSESDSGDSDEVTESSEDGATSPAVQNRDTSTSTSRPGRGRDGSGEEPVMRARPGMSSSRQKHERRRAKDLAEHRRGKEVKGTRLTSISSGGTFTFSRCHKCGQQGHKQAACPKKN